MRLIATRLNDFLRRYKRPDHLDNDQAMIEIKSMATAVNKRIAADVTEITIQNRLDDAFQEVAEIFRGNGWPKPAVFVAAMDTINKRSANSGSEVKKDWTPNPLEIAANRINAGEPVGDQFLFGRLAHDLMATGDVTQDQIRKLRSALYFTEKHQHGEEVARKREDARLERHAKAAPETPALEAAE